MSFLNRSLRLVVAGLFVAHGVLSDGAAGPLRVLVLGDSLSEEYAFELPFSAPDSDPIEANIANWVEILAAVRADEVSFGGYEGHVAAYPDYRNGGYEWNWAVPGFRTRDLAELIDPPLFPTSPEEVLDMVSCPRIRAQLAGAVDCVVVFCGGNDLSPLYAGLCTGATTGAQLAAIRDNLAATVDFVRSVNRSLPIVLVTVPDIGATPNVKAKVPDPALRAMATARIAGLNSLIADLAAERSIALADSFAITRRLDGDGPLLLNGTSFLRSGDPENRPKFLFAKDGFHAATAAQALLADEILRALNQRYSFGLTRLANRDILGPVLGLDPDFPFADWLAANGVAPGLPPDADGDGDGIPLLAEFAFGLRPTLADPVPWHGGVESGAAPELLLTWPEDRSGGYVSITPEWSEDLLAWAPAGPPSGVVGEGRCGIPMVAAKRGFVRLRFSPAP